MRLKIIPCHWAGGCRDLSVFQALIECQHIEELQNSQLSMIIWYYYLAALLSLCTIVNLDKIILPITLS